jgi:hypothetical protein
LNILVQGKEVKNAGCRIRCRIHGCEHQGTDQGMRVSTVRLTRREVNTYEICAMTSLSGNLSSSEALELSSTKTSQRCCVVQQKLDEGTYRG